GLIVVESALALILLGGAGLMIRTVDELMRLDPGFRPDHVVTTQFTLSGTQWTGDRLRAFYDDVVEHVRAIPGVEHAALAFALPIDGSQWNSIFIAGDKPVPERAHLPAAAFTPVSPGFFETMGLRLVGGRSFTEGDKGRSQLVVVVNETLAKRIWPGESAVGKRLKQGWPESNTPWREVIGVAADTKFNGLIAETPMQAFLPRAQQRSVVGLVVQQGLSMTLIGSAIGVAGDVALSRWIQGLLFGVTATDPATFAIVVAVLLTVGAAACLVPAWSAARVDPIRALR